MSGCSSQAVEQIAFDLAQWIEGLGLADYLVEAKLPTFTRDDDGTPRWRDPNTGKAMSSEQLEALQAMLRNTGDEPEHAVPLALLQLARQAKVREQLIASEQHTYESLAALRGESTNATRFFVHKGSDNKTVLLANTADRVLIPAFQFDAAGQPRAELADVLAPLLASGMDVWRVWGWLTQPAALLGGLVPEQAAADPDDVDIVAHAAKRLAANVAAEKASAKK